MILKYFKEGKTECGYGPKGILLSDAGDVRIISIISKNDKIVFREECDGYFCTEYTKEEGIKVLQEAIE